MASSVTIAPGHRHRASLVAAALHLVFAVSLVSLAVAGASALLPVALTLRVGGPGEFATVDLALAASIVVLVSAVCRVLASMAPFGARRRGLWYLEFSQVSGITVFLVAQLNGVTEAGTLILGYAVGAGAVGLLWVQSRGSDEHRAAPWPYTAAAAMAVVPWGIVALYQVTSLVAAAPLPPLVRVMTVIVLALFVCLWWVERRWQLALDTESRTEALRIAVSIAVGFALLVLVVGLARPSALF